ncbi:MAG: glycosyltransferase family 9 protein [Deltaproteobacteria bacterium]|nr:glycosyltransferase family 9 protein [Deltaproteobacteria bacterium]
MPGTELERLLFFQLKNLGDVIMSLPALALIKKHRPASRLTVVLRPPAAQLLKNHPLADEVLVHDFEPRRLELAKSLALVRTFRQAGYEASFHFDGQQRGGVLARWAGLPVRAVGLGLLGVGGLKCPWLYNRRVDLRPQDSPWESLALSHQRLAAEVLGLEPEPDIEVPGLMIPSPAKDKAAVLTDSLDGEGPIIGLTLLGRQREKSWPLDFWAEVVRELKETKKARIYVAGETADSVPAQNLARLSKTSLGNFCGLTDLVEFAALAAASDLFLTVDTGSAHLVSLTSTPLVTIFTATNPVQWGSLSRRQARLCYSWALARFGLANGPLAGFPVVRPKAVIQAAMEFLP